MSDYPEKPWDPAAEPAQPYEEEAPKLPVPEDELKDVLKEHEKWLKSVEDESDEALERRLRNGPSPGLPAVWRTRRSESRFWLPNRSAR